MTSGRVSFLCFLLIAFSRICFAQDFPPACSAPNGPNPSPVLHFPQSLELHGDGAFLWRPTYPTGILIDAAYDSAGKVTCASPISGLSFYWPAAIQALSAHVDKSVSGRFVITIPDPGYAAMQEDMKQPALRAACNPGDSLDLLLRKGRVLINRTGQREQAQQCFAFALSKSPQSVPALYGAAIVEALSGNTASAILHYEKLAALNPLLYEGRINLGHLYVMSGHAEKAKTVFGSLLAETPPLPVQAAAYSRLTQLYDTLGMRKDAASAQKLLLRVQTEIQLRSSHGANWIAAYDLYRTSADLALRLEEQRLYSEAEAVYRDALRFGNQSGKISDANRFELELGRSRCLRQSGDLASARNICSAWKGRIERPDADLNNMQWEGANLTRAKWELSCGDTNRGLEMIQAIIKDDAGSDSGKDPYRAAAPYRALETIFRARGETGRAQMAHELADDVVARKSAQVLQQIFQQAAPLFQERQPTQNPDKK